MAVQDISMDAAVDAAPAAKKQKKQKKETAAADAVIAEKEPASVEKADSGAKKKKKNAAEEAAKEPAAAAAGEEVKTPVDAKKPAKLTADGKNKNTEAKKKKNANKKARKEAAAKEAGVEEVQTPEKEKKVKTKLTRLRSSDKEAKKEARTALWLAEKNKKKEAGEEEAGEKEVETPENPRKRTPAEFREERVAKERAAKGLAPEVDEAPKKKSKKGPKAKKPEVKSEAPKEIDNTFTVFVRGLPFSVARELLEKDFAECGKIERLKMPLNEDKLPKGIAFIKFATQAGFDAALKFNNTDYGGRTIFVSEAGGDGKEKRLAILAEVKDGAKGEHDNTLNVFIRGLPWTVEEEALRRDFGECGEIERLKMPTNDEGKPKGIAFIKFATQAGFDAALEFDNTEYGGRTINVTKAGDAGDKGKDGKGGNGKGKDGKDGKGKDSKGKGKDAKGKGKDSKGKAKGKGKKGDVPLTTKQMAANDGTMVESTGEKKTFEDSDSE